MFASFSHLFQYLFTLRKYRVLTWSQCKIEKSFSPKLTDYFIQEVRNIAPLIYIAALRHIIFTPTSFVVFCLIQPQNQTQQRGNNVLKSLPFTNNPALVTTSLKQ
jgi:hypothetical protein